MIDRRTARATHLRSRVARMCVVVFVGLATSGCAIPILGGLTLNHLFTAMSISSTAFSGKGLGEHALDRVTGLDCRLFEAAVRQDREVCEAPGSVATAKDFRGFTTILAMMRRAPNDAAPVVASRPAPAGDGATAGASVAEPAPRLVLSLDDGLRAAPTGVRVVAASPLNYSGSGPSGIAQGRKAALLSSSSE